MTNIFLSEGVKGQFIRIIYNQLMTRKEVSYESVFISFKPQFNSDYFKKCSISCEDNYGDLKKAFSNVIKALEEKESGCIINNGKRRGKTFRYVGKLDDPLFEEQQVFVKNTLQDYVRFCKESSGIFPMEWLTHFFENSQLLLEMRREKEKGLMHLQTSADQELKGIERLPYLNEHIVNHHVLTFVYHPFGKTAEAIIMHPHFLKEYNRRWFLFGYLNGRQTVTNFALDRIESDPQIVEGICFVDAPAGTYSNYFKNIVGVSHEKNNNGIETVVIRTKSLYMHELVISKKFHPSQIERKKFGTYEDGTYGEFTMEVEPNRELKGRIMSYGDEIMVMAPQSLVDIIKQSVQTLYEFYVKN